MPPASPVHPAQLLVVDDPEVVSELQALEGDVMFASLDVAPSLAPEPPPPPPLAAAAAATASPQRPWQRQPGCVHPQGGSLPPMSSLEAFVTDLGLMLQTGGGGGVTDLASMAGGGGSSMGLTGPDGLEGGGGGGPAAAPPQQQPLHPAPLQPPPAAGSMLGAASSARHALGASTRAASFLSAWPRLQLPATTALVAGHLARHLRLAQAAVSGTAVSSAPQAAGGAVLDGVAVAPLPAYAAPTPGDESGGAGAAVGAVQQRAAAPAAAACPGYGTLSPIERLQASLTAAIVGGGGSGLFGPASDQSDASELLSAALLRHGPRPMSGNTQRAHHTCMAYRLHLGCLLFASHTAHNAGWCWAPKATSTLARRYINDRLCLYERGYSLRF